MLKSREIRQAFLDFFKNKGHYIAKSSPVIPEDDPTLLFTNAGMNQFKDIFLGIKECTHKRVADVQKCIRAGGKHNDLEAVGKDGRHHTFFEMLGNWSFGDYYKEESIKWGWEFLTEVMNLPKEKLYVSVYKDDDESYNIWKNIIGIPAERIYRLGNIEEGDEENFWSMGDTGPCGPCTEIIIDQGEEMKCGDNCGIGSCNCDRFLELWNHVFMEFNRDENGNLHPLPMKSVDTGMGLERLVSYIQKKNNSYDTDLFMPIINKIVEITGKEYSAENIVPMRVISDHIRALTFAITDGAFPGNEGRGYVLRRILRRAARFGHLLGMKKPFIYSLVSVVVDEMGHVYPELIERANHVALVIKSEEERFLETLERGLEIFEKTANEVISQQKKIFPGKEVFLLHDTYGFPIDLTRIMAEEKGLSIDEDGFNKEMEKQREKGRSSHKFKANFEKMNWVIYNNDIQKTEFLGYDFYQIENCKIIRYVIDDENNVKIITDKTPFYAETGGQIGDSGLFFNDEMKVEITDTQKDEDFFVHIGKLVSGEINDKPFTAVIDIDRRKNIMRNHSATHLLHKALREVLGEQVKQAGSLVTDEKLRFDFNHYRALTKDELYSIEKIVNEKVMENLLQTTEILNIEEAKKKGAIALFGEKYSEMVRVVSFGDYSKELCGGTHLKSSGEIGLFVILSETAIASGVRRIEAITGKTAYEYYKMQNNLIKEISKSLSAKEENIIEKINNLLASIKEKEKELQALKNQILNQNNTNIYDSYKEIKGIPVYLHKVDVKSVDDLKVIADNWKSRNKEGILLLGSEINGKANFLAAVSKNLIGKYHAGNIIKEISAVAGGSGGGKPDMAMAGGKDINKINEALNKIADLL